MERAMLRGTIAGAGTSSHFPAPVGGKKREAWTLYSDIRMASIARTSREKSTTPNNTVSRTSSSRQTSTKITATTTAQIIAAMANSRVTFYLSP